MAAPKDIPRERKLPDWLSAYRLFTDNTESPESFHIWTALWTLSGLLQRKVWLPFGHTTIYPNLYVVLVAPPGKARKTAAIRIGSNILSKLKLANVPSSITREALIKLGANTNCQHEWTNPEGEKELILHNSLSFASDEFAVFLGRDNFPMIAMLTDWFDCASPWIYETKNSGTDRIDGVWFNMLAASTADWLGSALPPSAIGGGFTSRILFVVEYDKRKSVPVPIRTPEEERIGLHLLEDAAYINHNFCGPMTVSKAGLDLYSEWYMDDSRNQGVHDSRVAGYLERKPLHVLKLAMPVHFARKDNMILDEEDIHIAIKLLDAIEPRMPDAFNTVGGNKHAPTQAKVLEYICRFDEGVPFAKIYQIFWRDVNEEELNIILSGLGTMGAIMQSKKGAGSTHYVKNPKFSGHRK